MNLQIEANIPGHGYARVEVEGDIITSVRLLGAIHEEKPYVSPGLIDIQLNGFAGVDFSDPTLDVQKACSVLPSLWETGVTTFCPTLITNSQARLLRSFEALEEVRRSDARFARAVPCYHLEGPYVSPFEARGVHETTLMRDPDWGEFEQLQSAAGNRIGFVTLAPELPGAIDFIRRAHASGVIVALGHTDATPEQIHQAAKAGAVLSTHLGNGCPEYIHRHRAPLWAQLADDSLGATVICDGFHLPSDMVRIIVRAKGLERTVLVTDAVHVATLPPGQYSLVGTGIELLPTGQVVTRDRRCMAGSAVTLNRAVKLFSDFAQLSLEDALRAATTIPANLLRRNEVCASIAEGQPANLVLFTCGPDALQIERVVSAGEIVYAAVEGSVSEVLLAKRCVSTSTSSQEAR